MAQGGSVMAAIQKRGDLQWRARVRRHGYPPQSRTFNSRAEAEAWVRQIEGEMDRSVFVSRAEAESTTLEEALERYIAEYIPKLKSREGETYRARALQRRDIAKRVLATIRGKDIAMFIGERQNEGVGANTIKLDLGLLSRLFEVCRSSWGMESLLNPVPLAKTARPKLPPGRNRRLKPGEEEELLTRARAYGEPIPSIISLALETAMRRGELASLRWEQIDLKRQLIHLTETKNGTPRDVPLSTSAVAILRALPRRLDGSVFNITPGAISQAFARISGRASPKKRSSKLQKVNPLVDLRFHDLRHEATSRIFEKGFNPMEAAAITGHKTLQMLKRYTHLRAEDLAKRMG